MAPAEPYLPPNPTLSPDSGHFILLGCQKNKLAKNIRRYTRGQIDVPQLFIHRVPMAQHWQQPPGTGRLCRFTYLSSGTAYPHRMTPVWVGGWKVMWAACDVSAAVRAEPGGMARVGAARRLARAGE